MAQVMSTFSRLEQSRFEAFRRATFSADAVSRFTAHCLIEEQHRPVSQGVRVTTDHERWNHQKNSSNSSNNLHRPPVLSEVCAPGQASEITMIVSTLAKSYAQRLIKAARQHAIERIQQQHSDGVSNGGTTTAPPMPADGIVPISPDDIFKAFEERRANGSDPGFFLQPVSMLQSTRRKSIMQNDYHQSKTKLLAALQAQEDYDNVHGVPMEVDSDGSSNGNKKEQEQEELHDEHSQDGGYDDDDLGVDWGDTNAE
jgi:hypothetical protein